jgi:hypothetical protein
VIPLIRAFSEDSALWKRLTNSSSLSAVRTMCHTVQTPIYLLFHPSGRRVPSVRTLHCIEKLLSRLHPSGRFRSTSGRLSVLEQFQILSKFQEREDQSTVRTMWYPILSGRLIALVRTRVQLIWKLPIRL